MPPELSSGSNYAHFARHQPAIAPAFNKPSQSHINKGQSSDSSHVAQVDQLHFVRSIVEREGDRLSQARPRSSLFRNTHFHLKLSRIVFKGSQPTIPSKASAAITIFFLRSPRLVPLHAVFMPLGCWCNTKHPKRHEDLREPGRKDDEPKIRSIGGRRT